ncbi:hypothetical protein [Burkholderia multivorans]|uniref:hypothetical protein n=1 Tax=Burkholderia multivorans TaxID=87883 RepID=UPI0021C04917|nr:hypothetical protein [Burkholderia multivorans]MDN7942034.1 hypothetical protein [Burkholderia multivorans]
MAGIVVVDVATDDALTAEAVSVRPGNADAADADSPSFPLSHPERIASEAMTASPIFLIGLSQSARDLSQSMPLRREAGNAPPALTSVKIQANSACRTNRP